MRWPSQAASTPDATPPTTSPASISGPRYRRSSAHTATATSTPRASVRDTYQPSSATNCSGSASTVVGPYGVITSGACGATADHSRPTGSPAAATATATPSATASSRPGNRRFGAGRSDGSAVDSYRIGPVVTNRSFQIAQPVTACGPSNALRSAI